MNPTRPISSPVAFTYIESKPNALLYKLGFALAFAVATAIAAQIRIPLGFTPVPMTLQTLFVFSSGLFLGAQFGLLSQVLYISMGLAGAPVFTNGGGGVEYIWGATGGYLIGFLLFSYLSGELFYGKNLLNQRLSYQMLLLYALSVVCVFLPGVSVLKVVRGVDWSTAIQMGFVPFIIGDLVKIFLGLNLVKWLGAHRGR